MVEFIYSTLHVNKYLHIYKSLYYILYLILALRIVKDLRSKLYKTMLNQETAWFDTKGSGELINRLSNDTFQVGNSLSQNLSDGLRSSVMVCAGTGMMVYSSPQLALIGLAVVPCVAGMAIIYGRYVRNITKELTDCFADIMKNGEERLGNIKTVKMFCKETYEALNYTHLLTDALNLGYKDAKARAIFYGLVRVLFMIIYLHLIFYMNFFFLILDWIFWKCDNNLNFILWWKFGGIK